MNLFGYIRTSTPAQSVAEQQDAIDAWATKRGLVITRTYVDEGVSGKIPFGERPAGAALSGEVRRGDTVVAPWLDRMFRRADDCLNVTDALHARGVSLYLLDFNDGGDDITAGTMSRMILHVAAAFAEHERSRIGQRISSAKASQKQRGRYLGGKVPFGFVVVSDNDNKGGKLVPDEQQQAAIEAARRLYAERQPLRAIQAYLDAAGHKVALSALHRVLSAS